MRRAGLARISLQLPKWLDKNPTLYNKKVAQPDREATFLLEEKRRLRLWVEEELIYLFVPDQVENEPAPGTVYLQIWYAEHRAIRDVTRKWLLLHVLWGRG